MNKFLCLVTVTSAWKDKGRHSGGQNVASCWSLELIRSVEACCARIMGFNRWFVDHIRICHRAGDMAVAEIARVLMPGGIIITSVPRTYYFPQYRDLMGHIRHYTPESFGLLLALARPAHGRLPE